MKVWALVAGGALLAIGALLLSTALTPVPCGGLGCPISTGVFPGAGAVLALGLMVTVYGFISKPHSPPDHGAG